jgi:hypothetical protein
VDGREFEVEIIMIWVNESAILEYSKADAVSQAIKSLSPCAETKTVCHSWLSDSLPKRFIFNHLYGNLLSGGSRKSILDIGGGITGLTGQLAHDHDYTLVDIMAHDDIKQGRYLEKSIGREFLQAEDWFVFLQRDSKQHWDTVIANDLFPNVDQRLVPFLESVLPRARRVVVSLTYYNAWRWYLTRRVDADEILTQMSWDHSMLSSVLARYSDRIVGSDFAEFGREKASVYPNGRHVCLVAFTGTG